MKAAGLQKTAVLQCGDSNPYAYGEWLGAPGKPTVFLYAHHDVQPINFEADWKSPRGTLTARDGRLYGRGAADDKGAITAQLGAVAAFLKTHGSLPVNVKMLVEGEEEVGSRNLAAVLSRAPERLDVRCHRGLRHREHRSRIALHHLCSARHRCRPVWKLQSATSPVHSGMAGGFLADAAIALNVLLARLYWKNGPLPIPQFYDNSVRPTTRRNARRWPRLPVDEAKFRRRTWAVLASVRFRRREEEQSLRADLAQAGGDGHRPGSQLSGQGASNQVLPKAAAKSVAASFPTRNPRKWLASLAIF